MKIDVSKLMQEHSYRSTCKKSDINSLERWNTKTVEVHCIGILVTLPKDSVSS